MHVGTIIYYYYYYVVVYCIYFTVHILFFCRRFGSNVLKNIASRAFDNVNMCYMYVSESLSTFNVAFLVNLFL